MWHWIFYIGSTHHEHNEPWLSDCVSLMTANRVKPPSHPGKWYSHTPPEVHVHVRAKGCNETKSGEHCGLGTVSGKVRGRWESLRENSSEEWGGVKKGQTRVPLEHLSGSQQKKPEPAGMQPEGTKNIFIWQLTRSGYSSVSTANGYKCWEAPESKLRNHTMCRMSLGARRDCVWEFMLCVFWDSKGRQGWSNLGGEQQ